ncbi:SCO family protein [Mucilaginibacter calamicampi]|uniref:SCO family protein n=1 Tax=Mucilaginibacter calamicampi TaxID=1302352 RepID=A0ABW2YUI2_9SPHI
MRKILLAAIVIVWSGCKFNDDIKRLPIAGNRDVATKVVNGQTVTDTVYQTIPEFKTVNQYGDSIKSVNLDANIYVADFFFTTCPSICPTMHRNMLKVYEEFKDMPDFKIISYTIDPKNDSAAVLKKYADKLGIEGNRWWLLQGKKEEIYKLSQNYLVTFPVEDAKEKFIHDGFFILVDKQKRIRGQYDGTQPDSVQKLINDIKILRAEPEQK